MQGFLRCFTGNYFGFGQDCSLAENLCFFYRLFLGIDYFKSCNSVVVIIVLKNSLIGSVGNSTVGTLEFIVGVVKVSLQAFKLLIIAAPCLCIYHRHSFLAYKVHTHHSVKGLTGFLNSGHYLVFSEKELAVNNGVSVVSHTRIGGNYLNILLALLGYGDSLDLAFYLGNSLLKLLGKWSVGVWQTGRHPAVITVSALHTLVPRHCAKHHIGIIDKILIAGYSVSCFTEMHPARHLHRQSLTLLEEKNICSGLRSCIFLKCVIRQTHSTKQIAAFGKVTPCLIVHLVHCELACYDSHNTAGLDLIYAFYGKVIVYLKAEFVISLVRHLIISKRNITDNNIERVVIKSGLFKSGYLNTIFGVQKLCYSTRNAVQLHSVEF